VAALEAAAATGREIALLSAADSGISAGPGWFRELVAAARTAVPGARSSAWLDCGGDAGAAQAAIRARVEGVVFTGRADVGRRLAEIAAGSGVRLLTARPALVCDLVDGFFADAATLRARCVAALA
jgi:acyl-CoA reductase-like NAD-dependent aldehyde dehydrogenase